MTLHILRGLSVLRAVVIAACLIFSLPVFAASIRGVVSDATGARVTGATVVLIQNGKPIATAVSAADGSYELNTGNTGRFFLVVSSKTFRQLQTPSFYAGSLDSIERNLVLEPEWVRQSIVVTATGTPTPQPQTGAATSVISSQDLDLRTTLTSDLRLMPGTSVVQTGQSGSQTSLFVRGGDSDDNMVLVDGVSAGDLGGRFDFGTLPTTGVESAEVYRGTNSGLYGADAESSVVGLTTLRGTTPFPSIFLRADGGNFNTMHEEAALAGAHNKLDYYGAYSWLQTSNDLPNDQHHLGAAAGNLGWQLSARTQIRGTVHYNVASTGVPNAWDFYHVTDHATQKDQDLYVSGSIDNQTTAAFHNMVRYGLARKREQSALWQQSGSGDFDAFGDSLGYPVTIVGANGASATGQAVLDYAQTYPYSYQLVSNRDQLVYQGDYRFTPHIVALVGFHFEDERGSEYVPTYSTHETTSRTNYDYLVGVHGDFKNRFYYSLGGDLEHYSLFGVETTPRAGFSWYALRPRSGIFSGTRILFNYGDAVREPALTDEFGSLYKFLVENGFQSTAQQLNIGPLSAPRARMYDGGAEQAFLSERILLRVRYFHNQFNRQIEYVGGFLLPSILPGLTPDEQQQLIDALGFYYTNDYPLSVNTQAFRAQGIESSVEGGIGRDIFLRGGYTYLDAVVQQSFNSDNEALLGGYAPTYNGIPIGAFSPLVGARPFRRPPHTGFITATYTHSKIAASLNAAFASRSDDSTYLEFADANGGNSLLLPNRNLDYGFAKIDLGASYQWKSWLGFYGIAENLTNTQHMSPIGYPSLPFNFRTGMRFEWGLGNSR
ncbi:MAG TPA: TonB-dependent receptor plug domain-containing protein [Terracidiphilus sp.]|nr:TonB-dependent receptor plug domain-containing protein [Terracidiphilus sp.]